MASPAHDHPIARPQSAQPMTATAQRRSGSPSDPDKPMARTVQGSLIQRRPKAAQARLHLPSIDQLRYSPVPSTAQTMRSPDPAQPRQTHDQTNPSLDKPMPSPGHGQHMVSTDRSQQTPRPAKPRARPAQPMRNPAESMAIMASPAHGQPCSTHGQSSPACGQTMASLGYGHPNPSQPMASP